MRVEEVNSTLEGAKRQPIPVVIHWNCPECGEERETDLRKHYLLYPEWGEQVEVPGFCLDCDEVEPVRMLTVVPRLTVESA